MELCTKDLTVCCFCTFRTKVKEYFRFKKNLKALSPINCMPRQHRHESIWSCLGQGPPQEQKLYLPHGYWGYQVHCTAGWWYPGLAGKKDSRASLQPSEWLFDLWISSPGSLFRRRPHGSSLVQNLRWLLCPFNRLGFSYLWFRYVKKHMKAPSKVTNWWQPLPSWRFK